MALLAFVDIVHRKARFVKGFCNIAPIIRVCSWWCHLLFLARHSRSA